jgi:hypothetical protein
MKRAPGSTVRTRPAGPRLRCFLDGGLLAIAFAVVLRSASAQLVVPKPIRVRHVEGLVCDRSEKPVANAQIMPVRRESNAFHSKTDDSGNFAIDHAAGRYLLRITAANYSPAAQAVIIGSGFRKPFRRTALYVILGPAACMDACSTVYASKKEYDQAVRMYAASYR